MAEGARRRARARTQPSVLVVCTGNLCRSPLAEALLRRRLQEAGLDADVASAGTAAPPDATPDPKLQRVATEHDWTSRRIGASDWNPHMSRRPTSSWS